MPSEAKQMEMSEFGAGKGLSQGYALPRDKVRGAGLKEGESYDSNKRYQMGGSKRQSHRPL